MRKGISHPPTTQQLSNRQPSTPILLTTTSLAAAGGGRNSPENRMGYFRHRHAERRRPELHPAHTQRTEPEWYHNPSGSGPAQQPPNDDAHHAALPSKGKISGISENGHFKYVESLHVGDFIDPFGETEIAPHFPEETADQGRARQ